MSKEFWVTDNYTNSVLVCLDGKILAKIPVGKFPRCVAFNLDGSLAFVANYNSRSVSVIDAKERKVVHNISVELKATCCALTPDQKYLCVTAEAAPVGLLLLYANGTYQLAGKIPVGNQPSWVSTAHDKVDLICVSNFKSKTVSIINTNTKTVAGTIPLCDGPMTITMTPRGDKAYAPCPNLGCLNFDGGWSMPVIDVLNQIWASSVAVDFQPMNVAVGKTRAYVTEGSYLAALQTSTDTVVGSVLTAGQVPWPTCVAFDEQDQTCVVTDPPAALVSIVDAQNLAVVKTMKLQQGVDHPSGVSFRP